MADTIGKGTSTRSNNPPGDENLEILDPLKLDLNETDFVNAVNRNIKASRKFFKEIQLYERRRINEAYWLGNQHGGINDTENFIGHPDKRYHNSNRLFARHDQNIFIDNLIYQGEATLKPIALSRVPDLIVNPGSNSEESKKNAELLTGVVNSDMRKRENRSVLGRAYKHRPIYFTGITKYRWNPELGSDGDYMFENIHPDNVDVDHTAVDNDTNKMDWIVHRFKQSVKQTLMRFPGKKQDLFEALGWTAEDTKKEAQLATKITISEVWFTWFEKNKDEEDQFERIEGVAWMFKNVLLKKMKNPNWDWQGTKQFFIYDENNTKKDIDDDQVRQSLMTGESVPIIEEETVFRNFFKNPAKPFYFMGYDQLGRMPYDETSRIEQSINPQNNINKIGKQILDIGDTRPKLVLSEQSGLNADDVQRLDLTDPDQNILVAGVLSEVFTFIPGEQPSPALFQNQEINRDRLFSLIGANATTRGEREAGETATGRQILREGDFNKQDDEVEETINPAAEWMAMAAIHMIKLRYSKDKMRRILGTDGDFVYESINRDLVEDGMEVSVSASGVDKVRRKQEAFERARLKMTDPLSFLQDTDTPNAKKRTEMLMTFELAPDLYLKEFIKEQDTKAMAESLANQPTGATPQENIMAGAQAVANRPQEQ